MSVTSEIRLFGNWRQRRSPGIPRLGLAGTITLLGGLTATTLTQLSLGWRTGLTGLALTIATTLPLIVKNPSGKNLYQVAGQVIAWRRAQQKGYHLYRACAVVDDGTTPLPGVLADTEMLQLQDSRGNIGGLIHHRGTNTYSVVFGLSLEGDLLVDPDTVDNWVARWSEFLAALGSEGQLVGASASIDVTPDEGSGLIREVNRLCTSAAPDLAREMLQEIASTYGKSAPVVRGRVALTFTAERSAHQDTDREWLRTRTAKKAASEPEQRMLTSEEIAAEIGARLPKLRDRLMGTGAAGVRLLSAQEIAEVVAVAYDPSRGPALEEALVQRRDSGITWESAGPTEQEESWRHLRHDSGLSATWQMTAASPTPVPCTVLRPLLEPSDGVVRKSVTLLYSPFSPAAAKQVADQHQRVTAMALDRKGTQHAGRQLDAKVAEQTAQEQAAGAGLLEFSLLVTATIASSGNPGDDAERLRNVATATWQSGDDAGVKLRRVTGAQAWAFALSLGFLAPHKHLIIPQQFRAAL
ncbi:SCO6880 family protein [Enterococcus hirae]|uniref:SCO6880 family protein n=1 Tax=Enterococcus hirae TaxID=1354 RepID=UPI00136B9271|nr:SCO6880 family protein [Enterococcus hirae]NAE18023.1 hypothetical protein [Enterococcus hirae]